MYLIDTDVISESRKADKANAGVRAFFKEAADQHATLYLSVITIGELRQGIEKIRHRGDSAQAQRLERWLVRVTNDYGNAILPFDQEAAQIWGRLRASNPGNPIDKQIAATVVTRNTAHYRPTGTQIVNPFS